PAPLENLRHNAWGRWASLVMGRPWRYVIAAFLVLAVLIAPALRMESRNVSVGDMPSEFEARRGSESLERNFVGGWMGATLLLLEARPDADLRERSAREAVASIAARLTLDPAVAQVGVDAISSDGRIARVMVLPRYAPERPEAALLVKRLRADGWPEARYGR